MVIKETGKLLLILQTYPQFLALMQALLILLLLIQQLIVGQILNMVFGIKITFLDMVWVVIVVYYHVRLVELDLN
jgi:hypothetical protein